MTENKKHRSLGIVFLVALLLLAVVATPLSLAWFTSVQLVPGRAQVIPGYFGGGDGSAEHPYIINKPIHLYNLAWLQKLGEFNKTYDENGVLKQYHFVLADNIDMSGTVIPPIGTAEYPFIGTFRSDGESYYTVQNLTVSNVIDNGEIKKRPSKVNELAGAEIVGMFGVIGQYNGVPADATYTSIVPIVEKFYLEDPEIRTQTANSLVGLIAGYVNGKVHLVGVKGGTLVSGTGNTAGLDGNGNVLSKYALIGDRDPSVSWGGVPSYGESAGGPIKIDANESGTKAALDELEGTDENGDPVFYVKVPGSREDGAFFVDDENNNLGPATLNNFKGTPHMYMAVLSDANLGQTINASNNLESLSKSDFSMAGIAAINAEYGTAFEYNKDFDTRMTTSISGKAQGITTGTTPPNATDTVSIPIEGENLDIPQNGIWFSPATSGNCVITFTITDNGQSMRYKSIYKIIRNDDANRTIKELKEIKLSFKKNAPGNGQLVIFQYTVEAGSEYVIGASTGVASDDSCAFFFLALAGASLEGSTITDTSHELFEVNFINTIPENNAAMDIASAGMPITVFSAALLNTGSEAGVSFAKDAMDAHAYTVNQSSDLDVFKRECVAIAPKE